jgi:hypothetical protein
VSKVLNIEDEVGKQLRFIDASCKLYDSGNHEEALRIAVSARVLFHNTKQSKGIIGGHSKTNTLKLLSTTAFKPGFPAAQGSSFLGFLGLCPDSGGFRPRLGDDKRNDNIPWSQWWSEEPIMAVNSKLDYITRKQLILECANRDGGAHVDEIKSHEYECLIAGLGISVLGGFNESPLVFEQPLRFANLAALRQIGYEILSSGDLTALAANALEAQNMCNRHFGDELDNR